MWSRCTHSEYIEGKTQEEIEQFVAFDYLPVINCHYFVVVIPTSLSLRQKNNGFLVVRFHQYCISLLNSLHGYQFSCIFENLSVRIIRPNNTSQYSTSLSPSLLGLITEQILDLLFHSCLPSFFDSICRHLTRFRMSLLVLCEYFLKTN